MVKVNVGYDDAKGSEKSIYRFIGDDPASINLGNEDYTNTNRWDWVGSTRVSTQDYSNTDMWKQVNLVSSPVEVQAYIVNSEVDAAGDLTQTAVSDQSIDALVVAGSAAVSGGGVGVSVSGAGAGAINMITSDVKSFIDYDTAFGSRLTDIDAGSVNLTAQDTSMITAVTGAASVAAAFGGVGVGVSIGVAGAYNEISNDVSAFIADADVTTTDYEYTLASTPHVLTEGDRVLVNVLSMNI